MYSSVHSAVGRREVRRWRARQSSIVYNEWSRFSEPSAISGLALTKAFVREGYMSLQVPPVVAPHVPARTQTPQSSSFDERALSPLKSLVRV